MPPVLPIDLEINLKKRARRRLVGAIALVLLMLIILPIILQDRTSLSQTEAIKITMPEPVDEATVLPEQVLGQAALESADITSVAADAEVEAPAANDVINQKVAEVERTTQANAMTPENKPQPKNTGFTIQIGVYSDMANVKQLQNKLTQAGFTSTTEKVTTEKGEKIRLNAGSYTTREAANAALEKLQSLKMTGFVKAKS